MTYIGTTSPVRPILGQMRFNASSNHMETYDGMTWIPVMNIADPGEYRLDINEGRVAGARYYTAQPINAHHQWPNMMTWTVETFGPTETIWENTGSRWYVNNSRFWFRNKKDLDWFVLRWSSQ